MNAFPAGETSFYLKSFDGLALPGAGVEGLEFEECTFTACDFSGATLRRCRFIDCSFIDCVMPRVVFSSSRLGNVDFQRCQLQGANWTLLERSRLSSTAELVFRDCMLNEGSFHGMALQELVLQGCQAHALDLREAKLCRADCRDTDFSGALFGRTDLTDADFSDATGFDIDVLDNVMLRAKFSRFEAVRLLQGLDIEIVD